MSQPVAWGPPPAERADAARNRRLLLATAREMLAAQGADKLTMDGLAERAGLGKGTVFRRFGTRAGIFQALLDDDERAFQQQVLSGPPPLGPGAPPLDRLIAYGRARIGFLIGLPRDRAGRARRPGAGAGPARRGRCHGGTSGCLLGQLRLGAADLDVLATQLTAALDGPLLLYLSSDVLAGDAADSVCGAAGPRLGGSHQARRPRQPRLAGQDAGIQGGPDSGRGSVMRFACAGASAFRLACLLQKLLPSAYEAFSPGTRPGCYGAMGHNPALSGVVSHCPRTTVLQAK